MEIQRKKEIGEHLTCHESIGSNMGNLSGLL